MDFITRYKFKKDESKPGRVLHSVKVGDVYISRLEINRNVVTGNYYHKKTNTIVFVEQGRVRTKYINVLNNKSKEMVVCPGDGIFHVPPMVALATKNIGKDVAILIFFSDRPLRGDDSFEFEVLKR